MSPPLSPAQLSPVLLSDLRSEEGGVGSVVVVVAVVVVGVLHVAVVVQVVLLPGLRVLAGHWLGGRRHDVGGGVRQHGACRHNINQGTSSRLEGRGGETVGTDF